MTTLISTAITWALTGLSKNAVVNKYADNRNLLVRTLAAAFALVSAFLVAIVNHQVVDSGIISVFVDAFVAWLASIGAFHVPSTTK